MTIKLVALDLDGTTINNDRVISQRNREVMQRAADEGVYVVIATGRPFSAVPKDVFEIEGIRYVLTSNGARITDVYEKRAFYENCLSPLAVEKAVELLRQHDYIIECFIYKIKETRLSYRNVEYILNTRNPVDNIYDFLLEHKHEIENININFEDISEKPAMREKLQELPETTITTSFDHNLEIGGATTSKAEALRQMGKILDIKSEEMMAIGDSPNDMAMMLSSGFPVAVGNAKDEVKAIAKYIAPTNDEDGVAVAIEKFVLNK